MFKDELNIAFENIKPSPELLDRVSAMMNEEVKRKKPPLQMRVVKYAGIAAAVALAAGGTLLFFAGQNNGVETSGAAKSIAPTAVASVTQENNPASEKINAAVAQAEEAAEAENVSADTVIIEEAAETEPAVASEPPATTTTAAAAGIYAGADSDADAGMSFLENVEGAMTFKTVENSISADAATINEAADDEAADAVPMMIAEAPAADESSNGSTEDYIARKNEEETPIAVDMVSVAEAEKTADYSEEAMAPQAVGDSAYAADAEEECLEADSSEADSDEYIGVKDIYADDPQKAFTVIEFIPDPLWNSVDPAEANAWYESFPIDLASGEVPDSLESYPNVYTFIKHFGISGERLKELIGYMITDEQIDILYHGTVAEITAEFASPLSIVKGDKIYSWYWITTHTAEDCAAAGITEEELLAHGY